MSVLTEARLLQPKLVAWRRDVHRHPELGFREHRTARIVANHLSELGLEVQTGLAVTGVVGLLKGSRPGPTIALRADMDALPIQEANVVDYASGEEGIMHACGHDGHTAMLMGAAEVLARHRDRLCGQVKFIFQPAEEGPGGAEPMIEAGVLEDPPVDAMIALHLHTDIPTGQVAIKYGVASTCAAGFELTITGKGGHGAVPHKAVDPIVAAAATVMAVQSIVSRQIDPLQAAVITIGTMEGGYRSNVIAHSVKMTGTMRSLEWDVLLFLIEQFTFTVRQVTKAYGCQTEIEVEHGYPAVVNDETICRVVEHAARSLLGSSSVSRAGQPMLGSEDFALFSLKCPSCFFRLGAQNTDRGFTQAWHHPSFDFDEEALSIGVAVFSQAVLDYCC